MKLFLLILTFISFQVFSSECLERRIYSTPQIMNVTCSENFEGATNDRFIMWENSMFLTVDYFVCPNRDYYVATVTHVQSNLLQTFKCNGEIKISKP